MKRLTCEMCGSTDLLKQDGVFVCQSCGTKYTVEEAKKMMVVGTVEVQGTVKVDSSDELKKLYQAARNAMEASDDKSALRHYESISAKDPNSWEALFYLVILKTYSITNGEIESAAISISNSLPKVFELINETIDNDSNKKEAVREVVEQCHVTANWLTGASHNFYKSLTKGNGVIALTGVSGAISSLTSTDSALNEEANRWVSIANIMCNCGNYIEKYFNMNDKDYKELAIKSWKAMLDFETEYVSLHKTRAHLFNEDTLIRFSTKIHQYDPSYEIFSKTKIKNQLKVFSIMAICFCWCPVWGLIFSIWCIAIAKKPEDKKFKKRGQIGLVLNIIFTVIFVISSL